MTFAPGDTSETVTVKVNGDTKYEPNEDFDVNLSTPVNATIDDGSGQGTITNDDAEPEISIDDVALLEGNSGTTAFGFDVTLSNPSSQTVTVELDTGDDTATTADNDYEAANETVTFAGGDTSETVSVTVNGDTAVEPDETFDVDLSNASSNSSIDDGTGLGTILDDDETTPPVLPGPPADGSDSQAPDTTITGGPKAKSKKKTATFTFTGTDARAVASFECKLDGGSFQPCTSPKSVKVKKGTHTFQVRAIDAAGNVDPSAATQSWKVKKKKKK